jgi:coenzyme F420 hydrogenase subunit beta
MAGSVLLTVQRGLCTGCGTCVAACPAGALSMRDTPAGALQPAVDEHRCVTCGRCLAACPGVGLPPEVPWPSDPFRGAVLGAWCGRATDTAVRATGQSGGVVSALLLYLLESGMISVAAVTSAAADGSLRAVARTARTRPDILAAQGSKYSPVALNTVLTQWIRTDRAAVVGLACHMHGLLRLDLLGSPLTGPIRYRLGLFCDRTLLGICADQMARDAGLRRAAVTELGFRSKIRCGWPGEVRFVLRSGHEVFFPPTLRTRLKDSFTPPRCRLCFDKLNIFSDVACGDAWGMSAPGGFESVLIARTPKGFKLVEQAAAAGYLIAQPIDFTALYAAQGIDRRRRAFNASCRVWGELGRTAPVYAGIPPAAAGRADPADLRACRSTLILNIRVSESATAGRALMHVWTARLLSRLRSLLKPLHVLRGAR